MSVKIVVLTHPWIQEEAPFILCTSNPTEYISDLAQVNHLFDQNYYICLPKLIKQLSKWTKN